MNYDTTFIEYNGFNIVMKQKRITYHDFYTLDHDLLTKENKDFLVSKDILNRIWERGYKYNDECNF